MAPMVPLGMWSPDQPDVSNGGLRIAKNTVPAVRGYDSMPGLLTVGSGNLNSACRGAISGRARVGQNFLAAGTVDRLYLITTGTLTNESQGGGSPYALDADGFWSMVLYGSMVIATNGVDPIQVFTIGTSTEFADLSADAPLARHLAVVRDFVVAGNIIGQGVNGTAIATAEDALQWCALDNPTSWPEVGTNAAKSVQSDWQPLAGNGGQVTDIVGGSDYGIVFQERSVWRMDYEGGDTFWRFTPIDENRGCWIQKAAIRVGGTTYFPAEDGFFATDGMQTVPIGNELVDQFFIDHFQDGTGYLLNAAYIAPWKCVAWLFMGEGATAELPNTLLVYNVQSSRWAYANVSAEWLTDILPFSSTLDDDSTSLDSGTWGSVSLDIPTQIVRRTPAAFDASHGLSTFTGDPLSATFETNEFEPEPGSVATVRSIRPVFESFGASMSGAILSRNSPSDDAVLSATRSPDGTGKMCVRATGRYLAATFFTSGEFRNFSGFDVDVVSRGAR